MNLGPLNWLADEKALMAMLAANEVQGLALVAAVIFCETGLVILPFLPGDSLLFALGAFAGLGHRSPLAPMAAVLVAAIAGDGVNFVVARSRIGKWLLRRGWISDAHMTRTRAYFDRYGASTITIGRFVPVVRTVAPFVAGLTGMDPKRFVFFNVAGALAWTSLMVLGGFWLGRVPWVSGHLGVLSILIVAISLVPVGVQWWRARRLASAGKTRS